MDGPKQDVHVPTVTSQESGKGDVSDAGVIPKSQLSQSTRPVRAVMPVARDAEEYNMLHPERGTALILNHFKFDYKLGLNNRNGTSVDCRNLKKLLSSLGFEVKVLEDATYKEIQMAICTLSAEDHSKKDCLLVAVMTHGHGGVINARDETYCLDKLWMPFTADQCPTLAGKPKIFLVQACQGDNLEGGTKLHARKVFTDAVADYRIPNHVDFVFAYSTIPGFLSWRNPDKGSWFIQAFYRVMKERGTKEDFLSLLTVVCRTVALDFESVSLTPDHHGMKQTASITSMLLRKIYFRDKKVPSVSK